MRKRFGFGAVLAVFLAACLLLAGCSVKDQKQVPDSNSSTALQAIEEEVLGEAVPAGKQELNFERSVIMTAALDFETLDFEKSCTDLEAEVKALGGHIESMQTEGAMQGSIRVAHYTLRIPAEKYTDFLDQSSRFGSLLHRSENSQDVTSTMIDIQARMKVLRTQQDRLLELMEQAGDLEALLLLQQNLTEIQYELESLTANQRLLKNQVSYSTVNILMQEVSKSTPAPPKSYGDQAWTTFVNSWKSAGCFFQQTGLVLIQYFPLLLLVAGVVILLLIVLKRRKHQVKQQPGSQESQLEQPPASQNEAGRLSKQESQDDKK